MTSEARPAPGDRPGRQPEASPAVRPEGWPAVWPEAWPEGWPEGWPEAGTWLGRARRLGPLRYSDLGPRRPGPPEPGEELARWLADAVDGWWEQGGRPDPYVLVVVSGDDGALARRVLELGPRCLAALRYILVDDPPPAAAATLLSVEEPAFLFPAAHPSPGSAVAPDDGEEHPPATGVGPLVTCLAELPAVAAAGAVVSLGAACAMPADHFEWRDGAWWEIRLGAGPAGASLEETAVPAGPTAARLPAEPAGGTGRYALLHGATAWLRSALASGIEGPVAVVDRWTAGTEPFPPGSAPPLALDQLRRVARHLPPGPVSVAGDLACVCWKAGG